MRIFLWSLSSSSRTAPPSWTLSRGWARAEVALEGPQGWTPTIRGPPSASTCPTSPSASETPTFSRCLGCVDRVLMLGEGGRGGSDVTMWCSGAPKARRARRCCHLLATGGTTPMTRLSLVFLLFLRFSAIRQNPGCRDHFQREGIQGRGSSSVPVNPRLSEAPPPPAHPSLLRPRRVSAS